MTRRRLPEDVAIPIRITLVYIVISAVWIFFSDLLVVALTSNPATIARLSTYKGFFFISVSGLLLFSLIRNNIRALEESTARLKESEEKFRELVEHTSDWVWELDENMLFTYSNQKVEDVLGYTPNEVIGKHPTDFMAPDEAQRVSTIIEDLVVEKAPFNLIENTLIHKNGLPVIVEVSGLPIVDSEGRLRGCHGINRDITERKQAEEVLRERDLYVRRAYADALGAVTGGRLIIMTIDEIRAVLGEPITNSQTIDSYKDLAYVRAQLIATLESQFSDKERANELLLAASEAITNAVKHAGKGTYQVLKRNRTIQLMVEDAGPGIDFTLLPKATLLSGFSTKQSLGIGFSVMLELSDRVLLSTQPGGTIVVLEKRLTAPEEGEDIDQYKAVD
ncbi:MAG TPA: PAS domain S-box protein [Candidatus Aquicultor sp.]|jgi:PAS domain S-box-containing protein